MRRFQIFDKIDSFLENFSNALDAKKVDYIFEEPLNLHITVGYSFFSLLLWSQAEEAI